MLIANFCRNRIQFSPLQAEASSGSLSSLELSDTKVYAPEIRARLGTSAHFCEEVVLKLGAFGIDQTCSSSGPQDCLLGKVTTGLKKS